MNSRWKKITGSILAATGAVSFLCLAAGGTAVAFVVMEEQQKDPWDTVMAGLLVALGIACLALVQAGMRLADSGYKGAEKERFFGRWVKNTLFAGALVIFVCAAYMSVLKTAYYDGDMKTLALRILLTAGAVLAASILYIRMYLIEFRKRKRIRALAGENVPGGSRYSMVIDQIYSDKEDPGNRTFLYKGLLHGKLRKGETAYVIIPGGGEYESVIRGVFKGNKQVNEAADTEVSVILDSIEGKAYPQYALLCGTKKPAETEGVNQLEARQIRGYVQGYDDHPGVAEYMSLVVWAIVHGSYLIPVYTRDTVLPDPSQQIPADAEYMYATVTAAMVKGENVLPVYTDWDALGAWRNIMDRDCRQGTVIRTFKELEGIVRDEYAGVVINPFGPRSFYLSAEFLQNILEQETTAGHTEGEGQ